MIILNYNKLVKPVSLIIHDIINDKRSAYLKLFSLKFFIFTERLMN